jgi:hypothetical protein
MAAVFSMSKKVLAEIASFHAAVSFVNALEPTGGCKPNQLLSLMIARHLAHMQGASIDYALKDTPHADWDFSGGHRILHSHPKWQASRGQLAICLAGVQSRAVAARRPKRAVQVRTCMSFAAIPPGVRLGERGGRGHPCIVKLSPARCGLLPRRCLRRHPAFP